MSVYLKLPLLFFTFWFIEAPNAMLHYFFSLNNAFLQQFSLPILLKTYFRPIKNEYRQGLIWFSIGMGMVIKLPIILLDVLLFMILIAIELGIIISFVLLPFATYILLFL